MPNAIRLMVLAAVIVGPASPASAQETIGEVISFLVTNQGVRTDDFERDRAAAEAARDSITRALLVNLASVPLASSSSGFFYRLNPELGTVERPTENFGAFFVERALTPGRRRMSVGASGTTSGFDRLGELHLRDGTLLTVANQFRDEPEPFDTESLTLRVRSSTFTVFGNVGVTDRLEVGAALPLVQLRIEGERLNIYRGTQALQASGEGTASGIGDIALRAKYTLAASTGGAVAAAAEIRLPTGDENNLLGAGATAYRILGIGSLESGRLSVHGNGGFVVGGISDELNLAGAVAFAARPRLTISGEVLFRRVADLSEIQLVAEPHPRVVGVDTLRLTPGATGTTLANAVAGLKWNPARSLVIGAHAAFPLVRHGLTAPATPSLAVEYSF